MAEIGLVCGMESEARALGRWRTDPRVAVAISGADPDRAETAARRMADDGVHTLISWGLAGGLAPHLEPGALLQPAAVILPGGTRVEFDRGLMADFAILGSDVVVANPAEKAQLHERTGALAVDMETHRLALVSMDTGVDLKIARAVSDPAGRALPALAATALGPDGRPRIGRVLRGLALRPWDLPALLAAKRDSDRALASLRGAADDLLGGLVAMR